MPFSVAAPKVDEVRLPGESPKAMAMRLAQAKALAVAVRFPGALVIGCDQVAICAGRIIGKPGVRSEALRQLRLLSGRSVEFHTALCVHNSATGVSGMRSVPCRVRFRHLDEALIERYLEREPEAGSRSR